MSNMPVNVDELRRGGVVALKEKDMFSIWVKTACGNLSSKQIRKLADITDKYARGLVLFSSRQIPIIPFVHINQVKDVKSELARVEMELDRCGSRVRNLNVCYEDKICPEAVVNCISLGEKLENFFDSQMLHKIKIGVAGCNRNCPMVRTLTDIGFIGVEVDGVAGYEAYDAYAGGRLGLNPFVGIKIAGHLSKDECVKLVSNYFDLLKQRGRPGERSADILQRLGLDIFRQELTRDLKKIGNLPFVTCPFKLDKIQTEKTILRIRAICGEVSSQQARKIADIADKFGNGFIHFAVRGSPEIPGVNIKDLPDIGQELAQVDLSLIDNQIENFQSCFGNYCAENLADPQTLLRKIETKISDAGINNLRITVSACGCPNSCGIPHLSDIGFHGVVEPVVDIPDCSGCGLCAAVCKRKAIEVKNKLAVIDAEKCGGCGQCLLVCPPNAIQENRKGFAVLLGGRGESESRLGTKIAEFVSEEKALMITENLLKLAQEHNSDVGKLIDELGIERIQQIIVPEKELIESEAGDGGKYE